MERQRPWRFSLPPGIADPYFMCEMALALHMPVGEMCDRMSNYELNVIWPAYYRERNRLEALERDRMEQAERERQSRK